MDVPADTAFEAAADHFAVHRGGGRDSLAPRGVGVERQHLAAAEHLCLRRLPDIERVASDLQPVNYTAGYPGDHTVGKVGVSDLIASDLVWGKLIRDTAGAVAEIVDERRGRIVGEQRYAEAARLLDRCGGHILAIDGNGKLCREAAGHLME